MEYTVVIRTLGKAGGKYQKMLDSLKSQTMPPKEIIVYIAEGYDIPKETIGVERYVYVKKGMVAQRALPYDEVHTEYMLCLDDDLAFPPDTVKRMFQLLKVHNADVISPDIFPNAQRPFISELMMTITGRVRARRFDKTWGYKVMRTGGYSYNKTPQKEVYVSQTNAGACFLCRKEDFLRIRFQDELWLDNMLYPLGEDQIMYYKMYCNGLKQLTWYNHQFVHLDAGNNVAAEKEQMRLYGDIYFKMVFWHRFIYTLEKRLVLRSWSMLCITYYLIFTLLTSLFKGDFAVLRTKNKALKDAKMYLRSAEYHALPQIQKRVF